jgi:hypothetical protein
MDVDNTSTGNPGNSNDLTPEAASSRASPASGQGHLPPAPQAGATYSLASILANVTQAINNTGQQNQINGQNQNAINPGAPAPPNREGNNSADQVIPHLDLVNSTSSFYQAVLNSPSTTTRQIRQLFRSSNFTGPLTASEIKELHESLLNKDLSFTPVNTTPSQKRKNPATTRSPDGRPVKLNYPTIDQYFSPTSRNTTPNTVRTGLFTLLSEVQQIQSIMVNTAAISLPNTNHNSSTPPRVTPSTTTPRLTTSVANSQPDSSINNNTLSNPPVCTTPVTTQSQSSLVSQITNKMKHVRFQDQPTPENTNHDDLLLSLQERLEILPAALVPWRQSRSFLSAEAKARARADFIDTLAESGTIPGWAYGIEPLPGFVDQFLDQILSLKRMQAIELLQLVKQELQRLAVKHHETGVACQMTCQFIYGNDGEGWQAANTLLNKIIDADKAKCMANLQKRETTTRQSLVDDDTIKPK